MVSQVLGKVDKFSQIHLVFEVQLEESWEH